MSACRTCWTADSRGAQELEAILVKRLSVLHLRPMTAMPHFEQARVGNELDDRSRGIEKDVLVVDGSDDQRRSA